MKYALVLTAAALCFACSAGFTSVSPSARPLTSLSMKRNDVDNSSKTFAASALAAAYLITGVISTDAAFAMDGQSGPSFADSSSVMIAGRSGGRAGGRAAPRAMPRSAAPAATTKVYNTRTTVIQAPPVMGGGYGYGYGGGYYDPTPGIALNLGLSAVSAVGNGMRESRQNQMIYEERAELNASREREAEMAARLRQLEMMQMQQGGRQAQPQVIIAQPPVQAAPAQ